MLHVRVQSKSFPSGHVYRPDMIPSLVTGSGLRQTACKQSTTAPPVSKHLFSLHKAEDRMHADRAHLDCVLFQNSLPHFRSRTRIGHEILSPLLSDWNYGSVGFLCHCKWRCCIFGSDIHISRHMYALCKVAFSLNQNGEVIYVLWHTIPHLLGVPLESVSRVHTQSFTLSKLRLLHKNKFAPF